MVTICALTRAEEGMRDLRGDENVRAAESASVRSLRTCR